MKSSNLIIVIYLMINLFLLLALGLTWDWFYSSYSKNFQLYLQYFLFLLAHLSTLWVLLQIGWLLYWNRILKKYSINPIFSWIAGIYSVLLAAGSIGVFWEHFYQRGQPSSWMRVFNMNDQLAMILIWLSAFMLPLLILMIGLLWKGWKTAINQKLSSLYAKRWQFVLWTSCLALLAWGMILSFRDANILSTGTHMTERPLNYSWIAIYNPISALVALAKSVFVSTVMLSEEVIKQDIYFSRMVMQIGHWPGFFWGLFYGKIVLMGVFSLLSAAFSILVRQLKEQTSANL